MRVNLARSVSLCVPGIEKLTFSSDFHMQKKAEAKVCPCRRYPAQAEAAFPWYPFSHRDNLVPANVFPHAKFPVQYAFHQPLL